MAYSQGIKWQALKWLYEGEPFKGFQSFILYTNKQASDEW